MIQYLVISMNLPNISINLPKKAAFFLMAVSLRPLLPPPS